MSLRKKYYETKKKFVCAHLWFLCRIVYYTLCKFPVRQFRRSLPAVVSFIAMIAELLLLQFKIAARIFGLFYAVITNHPMLKAVEKTLEKNSKRLWYIAFIEAGIISSSIRNRITKDYGIETPSALIFCLSKTCNMKRRCRGCFAESFNAGAPSVDEVKNIIAQGHDIGVRVVALLGGETTLWPGLFEVISTFPDIGFFMFTNGLWGEETADEIAKHPNLLTFLSLEGNESTTDERRAPGTFEKVLSAVKLLEERNACFGASVTVTSSNLKEVTSDNFYQFLESINVSVLFQFPYIPLAKNPHLNMILSPDEIRYLRDKTIELRRKYPVFAVGVIDEGYSDGCRGAGRKFVYITPQLDVTPCPGVPCSAGSLRNLSLLEILQGQFMSEFRRLGKQVSQNAASCPAGMYPDRVEKIAHHCGTSYIHRPGHELYSGSHQEDFFKKALEIRKGIGEATDDMKKVTKFFRRFISPRFVYNLGPVSHPELHVNNINFD